MPFRRFVLVFAASLSIPCCLLAQSAYTKATTEAFKILAKRLAAGTYLIRVETKVGRTYSRVLVKL
jgi:hypothetical protein